MGGALTIQYKKMEHSKQMIRIIIEQADGNIRQLFPTDWGQIMSIYTKPNTRFLIIYAITPRDVHEYQKKIDAQNLGFMRVVR
jgi:hypothetical protein